jgi:stage II sporulation protein R
MGLKKLPVTVNKVRTVAARVALPTILAAFLYLNILPETAGSGHAGDLWRINSETEDIIRLHVIADNNSPPAQEFKKAVVQETRRFIYSSLDSYSLAGGKAEFMLHLERAAPALRQRLNQFAIDQLSEPEEIEVYLLKENFPVRAYGLDVLPPGKYTTLKITIGSGEGENWWCLLFPPLCLPFARASDPEKEVITEGKGLRQRDDAVPESVEESRQPFTRRWAILEKLGRWFGQGKEVEAGTKK